MKAPVLCVRMNLTEMDAQTEANSLTVETEENSADPVPHPLEAEVNEAKVLLHKIILVDCSYCQLTFHHTANFSCRPPQDQRRVPPNLSERNGILS